MNAYREGYCCGLLGRKCENPYAWNKASSMADYNKGFLAGNLARSDNKITIIIERENA